MSTFLSMRQRSPVCTSSHCRTTGRVAAVFSRPQRVQASRTSSRSVRASTSSAPSSSATAPIVAIQNLSWDEDPEAAEAATWTMGKAFGHESSTSNAMQLFDPSTWQWWWRSVAKHLLFAGRAQRMLYTCHVQELTSGGAVNTTTTSRSSSSSMQDAAADPPGIPAAISISYIYPSGSPPDMDWTGPGFADIMQHMRPEWVNSLGGYLEYLGQSKAEYLKVSGGKDFWYIFIVAVSPDHQRKGLGSVLVRHITAQADAAGMWCFIEGSNDSNSAMYARHGFKEMARQSWELPDVAPGAKTSVIRMARPPGGAAK